MRRIPIMAADGHCAPGRLFGRARHSPISFLTTSSSLPNPPALPSLRMRSSCNVALIFVWGSFLWRPAAVVAETVTIQPAADATLIEDAGGALANGADSGIFAGRTAQGSGAIRRALIRFDVAAAIPAGAQITSATLTLYMSKTRAAAHSISLQRVLTGWTEGMAAGSGAGEPVSAGDVTWLHTTYPGLFWTTPGGDFSMTISANQTVNAAGFYQWGSTPGVVADVQSWLDLPSENFGWILVGNEAPGVSAKRFDSREAPVTARRPILAITYSIPCTEADANCDGEINGLDVQAFVSSLITQSRCSTCAGDTDGDLHLTLNDIEEFVTAILNS